MGYTMSQTKEGAIKAVQTIEKKYGKDYWKKIGSKGGANGTGHAFGHGKLDPHEMGRIGGRISRRTKKPVVDSTDFSPTPAQSHSWFNTLRRK